VPKSGSIKSLMGARDYSVRLVPQDVIQAAEDLLERLRATVPEPASSLQELKERHALACKVYYQIAAVSRRREIEDSDRAECLRRLYPLRSSIERRILSELSHSGSELSPRREAASRSFFGVSAKQGVSIRYALDACVPTQTCGGGCYAHDGRDREIHHIFRGVLNYWLGLLYENGDASTRESVMMGMDNAIRYGIEAARLDQLHAEEVGFVRPARIRFSHVGEIAATPAFANAIAREVKRRDAAITCVIYTRHPRASELDPELFVVNFTLEGKDDTRQRFVPRGARIVSSAWNGELVAEASVNFLEHHVNRVALPTGTGNVCPVTADHAATPSCDAARCTRCFDSYQPVPLTLHARGHRASA
jgi:hypothetical protein